MTAIDNKLRFEQIRPAWSTLPDRRLTSPDAGTTTPTRQRRHGIRARGWFGLFPRERRVRNGWRPRIAGTVARHSFPSGASASARRAELAMALAEQGSRSDRDP
jgi:hypothetical protein